MNGHGAETKETSIASNMLLLLLIYIMLTRSTQERRVRVNHWRRSHLASLVSWAGTEHIEAINIQNGLLSVNHEYQWDDNYSLSIVTGLQGQFENAFGFCRRSFQYISPIHPRRIPLFHCTSIWITDRHKEQFSHERQNIRCDNDQYLFHDVIQPIFQLLVESTSVCGFFDPKPSFFEHYWQTQMWLLALRSVSGHSLAETNSTRTASSPKRVSPEKFGWNS